MRNIDLKPLNLILAVIIVLMGAFSSHAKDPVHVGIFDFPPFYSKDNGKPAQGLLIDIAKTKLNKIGRKAQFDLYHTPTLISNLATGAVDVGMLIKHPALIDTALYSTKPLSRLELVAFRGVNSPKLSSYMNLAGQKVLVLAGYGYGGVLAKMKRMDVQPVFVEASDIQSGMDMLLAGRADYFLSYLKPSREIAKRKGYLSNDKWLVSDAISKFDVYWVVSKKIENAEKLMRQLESVQ